MLIGDNTGTRSSTDGARPDSAGGGEDETVVEPDQGNGEELHQSKEWAEKLIARA